MRLLQLLLIEKAIDLHVGLPTQVAAKASVNAQVIWKASEMLALDISALNSEKGSSWSFQIVLEYSPTDELAWQVRHEHDHTERLDWEIACFGLTACFEPDYLVTSHRSKEEPVQSFHALIDRILASGIKCAALQLTLRFDVA
jgi:hypothetical protein